MSILRALLLLFFLCSIANAQTALQLGTPIERELRSGQVHEFTVNLEENNFIQLVVEQRGIDVIVKAFSPSGKSLGEYDSPTGNDGPENVSFVAVDAGNYRVTVGPLEPKDTSTGRYQIKILELRQATDQELKTSKNLEATKAKGLALLAEIEETIPQIKSPKTRIKMQIQAAQFLWDIDEKRAAKLLADAVTGLKDLLASIEPADLVYENSAVSQLRYEVLNAVAARDPDTALNLLYSTSQMISSSSDPREQQRQESIFELAIANQIVQNNPNRALQIARQNLKRGYSQNLMHMLAQLTVKNPELGAELANEIAAKVLNEKLLKTPDAASLAIDLLAFRRSPQSPNRSTPSSLLTDDKYKELVRKVFDEALEYSQPTRQPSDPASDTALSMWAGLHALGPQLDAVVPGGTATIEKKLGEMNGLGTFRRFGLPSLDGRNSGDLSLQAIGKMPPEVREQQYIQLAYSEANNGDLARARQIINDHITNPYQRREALRNLEQQEVLRAMNKGKVEEALRALSLIRNPHERAQQLAQIASQIGPGQKRATALNLLEQARSILGPSPHAQSQEQMLALFEIARAFSRYDVKRAFEILDPLIDQFNEICAAARTLDGFGVKYYDDDELDLQNGYPLAAVAGHMSTVLGSLAMINFDRAKATTDRIRAPEVRLKTYLEIAQHTIKAAEGK